MTAWFESGSLTTLTAQEGAQPSVPGMPGGNSAAPQQGTTTQPGTGNPGGATPPPGGLGGAWFLPLIAVMFILMIFLSGRAQRAERKKKQELLNNLKKHDRIQTIGGILGTVTEIREDEVIVRIDDATNTRMHFAKSAIQQVVRPGAGSKADSSNSDEPELASSVNS